MNLGFMITGSYLPMRLTSSNYLLGFPGELEVIIQLLRCTRACLFTQSLAIAYFHNCAFQLRFEENGWSSRSKNAACCPIHVQINKTPMLQPVNFTKYHRPLHQSLKPKILECLASKVHISCH